MLDLVGFVVVGDIVAVAMMMQMVVRAVAISMSMSISIAISIAIATASTIVGLKKRHICIVDGYCYYSEKRIIL